MNHQNNFITAEQARDLCAEAEKKETENFHNTVTFVIEQLQPLIEREAKSKKYNFCIETCDKIFHDLGYKFCVDTGIAGYKITKFGESFMMRMSDLGFKVRISFEDMSIDWSVPH